MAVYKKPDPHEHEIAKALVSTDCIFERLFVHEVLRAATADSQIGAQARSLPYACASIYTSIYYMFTVCTPRTRYGNWPLDHLNTADPDERHHVGIYI